MILFLFKFFFFSFLAFLKPSEFSFLYSYLNFPTSLNTRDSVLLF